MSPRTVRRKSHRNRPFRAAFVGLILSCGADVAEVAFEPADEPFRATPPPIGPAEPLVLPSVQRFTLPNGVDVRLVERPALPLISWRLTFPGGALSDPPGKEGRAELCSLAVIDGGAPGLAERLGDLASDFRISSGFDEFTLWGTSLRRHLAGTIDLWRSLLQMPGMSDEVVSYAKRRIASQRVTRTDPKAMAWNVFDQASRGPEHPVVRTSATSLEALSASDCRQYRDSYFRPKGARLSIAGAITRPEVEAQFVTMFGTQGSAPPLPPVPAPRPRPERLIFADAPGASQATVIMWAPAPLVGGPDETAADITLSVLGGGSIQSRLGKRLRQMEGVTYGVQSYYVRTRFDAYLTIETAIETRGVARGIEEMVKAVSQLGESDATTAEIDRVTQPRHMDLSIAFETRAGILTQLEHAAYFGLPDDHVARIDERLASIDPAALRSTAAAYLTPEKVRFVVVGNAAETLPMLRTLTGTGLLGGEPPLVVNGISP